MLWDALLLQMGYNATLVAIGATLLGISSGITGTFLFLRKRALVSDAISHATLPGVGLAFLVMVALGGDGRNLAGLLVGSGLSAMAGLWCLNWLTRRTRLAEDAAIGAVLSVFFGFGIVILTVIQTLGVGRQAGLEGFLLGSTAGMLWNDALVIAGGGAATLLLILLLRRPMTLVAFDPEYAAARGISVSRIDMMMMGLVMAVTVVGLKIVGLILIVALLIIPAVTARFWTERSDMVVLLAGVAGGLSAYLGAAVSASAPNLPTGPIIVLMSFALFVLSLLLAPNRGVLAAVLRHLRFQRRVHLRQGLLALAQDQVIYEPLTLRLLRQRGLLRADGVATEKGRARAAKALRDEHRWALVRSDQTHEAAAALYDGLREIETVLTEDQISEIDRRIGGPREVPA
ncbi:metal ABC transporter permease [Phaeobacter gallaeciensis]|uniref:Manganese transport system membrane protein MntC n=1 Tax=Phaeobacter gallaeciensis TaxID=60890 RepID=A0AAC9ZC85_9RHOB|nr:metal ABC transporter permease [Phaeobacter gallaeciensis]AHD11056.1 ABC-type Mn2+/Zn2+ transport system, permease component [Phaeobacter gallaeciensis DSM 26640]ATE94319.1 manganese transport system membrane protein MntC [Phaeobacter gallaeciensis]ATE98592.1 manganese transport system membrane protein MntC [Phaeobacter gallaeciensis]ATF02983.1 manganese transport system membrane protein MntC [Phaeobacter gallaeciensis]ATF07363.1 manganese transport system membrane protein MntC [Phaeobacter